MIKANLNIKLKKQYFTNKIYACQGNMKDSWKTINQLFQKRSKSSNTECLKESGHEIVHTKSISETIQFNFHNFKFLITDYATKHIYHKIKLRANKKELI